MMESCLGLSEQADLPLNEIHVTKIFNFRYVEFSVSIYIFQRPGLLHRALVSIQKSSQHFNETSDHSQIKSFKLQISHHKRINFQSQHIKSAEGLRHRNATEINLKPLQVFTSMRNGIE